MRYISFLIIFMMVITSFAFIMQGCNVEEAKKVVEEITGNTNTNTNQQPTTSSIIYVSVSTGNDANSGLTPSNAVKTLDWAIEIAKTKATQVNEQGIFIKVQGVGYTHLTMGYQQTLLQVWI